MALLRRARLDSSALAMDEMLAEYGLDTTSAGLIAIAICAVGWFVASGGGGAGDPGCVIEL